MSETINGVSILRAETKRSLVADVQYMEPYASAAFNRKMRGIVPPGVYSGFSPVLPGGLNVTITSKGEADKLGAASVDVGGFQISVQQIEDITVTVPTGATTRIMLEATYQLGTKTDQVDSNSGVKAARIFLLSAAVQKAENQIELCRLVVPPGAKQLTPEMVDISARLTRAISLKLSDDIDSEEKGTAATPKAVKDGIKDHEEKNNPHRQYLLIANNLKEITNQGDAAVQEVLSNLGLGEAAKRSVGTGAGQIPDMSAFNSGAGWARLPDGTIIQCGVSIAGVLGQPKLITLPVPFTQPNFIVVTAFDSASHISLDCPSFAATPSGTMAFNLMSSRSGTAFEAGANWIAIGK